MTRNKKIALTGMLLAASVCLSFIENMIDLPAAPGVKIGLASIPVMFCMLKINAKTALFLCAAKSLFLLIARNPTTFIISLSGGLLSFIVMLLFLKKLHSSVILMSVAGGISHNLGQLAAASLLLQSASALYYAPVLIIAGTITGIFTGVCTASVIKLSGGLK